MRTAKQLTWSPYPTAGEILSRLNAGSAERPGAQDQWETEVVISAPLRLT